jgi:hypothetical protein
MSVFEIVVEPQVRRRRVRRPLSGKKRAATFYRIWHGLSELHDEALNLGDDELAHFLDVSRLLVEDKIASESSGNAPAFDSVDTSVPN